MASQASFKGILSGGFGNEPIFSRLSMHEDEAPTYHGPKTSRFLPGQFVKWDRLGDGGPFRAKNIAEYLVKYGPEPYEVIRTGEAGPHTPPQVIIKTSDGEHSFGEGWFKRVLRVGDICPVCAREWKRREMFFSTYIGCHCPESHGDER